ncbi:hypothetical protein ACGFWI_07040 [Streptomyces sp. NPDC048434]|uniref:hypothetical protein n=1 Tax=Streptomyces sp. NPDC048434 TaxID=3365549 RepID=UPI0037151DD9
MSEDDASGAGPAVSCLHGATPVPERVTGNFSSRTPARSLLHGVDSPDFRRHLSGTEPPATVARGHFEGVVTTMMRRNAQRIDEAAHLVKRTSSR